MKLRDTPANREILSGMNPTCRKAFDMAKDPDDYFRLVREMYRQADKEAIESGRATPEEIQRQNSIFPPGIGKHIEIDFHKLAYGTKSTTKRAGLLRPARERPVSGRRPGR